MPMASAFQGRSPRIHRHGPRKKHPQSCSGAGKVPKAGNPGRSAAREHWNGRENQQEKRDFAHHAATLRPAAPHDLLWAMAGKNSRQDQAKNRANAHNEILSRGYPQTAVGNAIA